MQNCNYKMSEEAAEVFDDLPELENFISTEGTMSLVPLDTLLEIMKL